MKSTTAKRLITVVDDDASIRFCLAQVLGVAGFETQMFASVEDALSAGCLVNTDVLITDLNMPGLDGWDLHRHAHAHYPRVPVIIVTGELVISPKYRELQIPVILQKPIRPDELLAALRTSTSSDCSLN